MGRQKQKRTNLNIFKDVNLRCKLLRDPNTTLYSNLLNNLAQESDEDNQSPHKRRFKRKFLELEKMLCDIVKEIPIYCRLKIPKETIYRKVEDSSYMVSDFTNNLAKFSDLNNGVISDNQTFFTYNNRNVVFWYSDLDSHIVEQAYPCEVLIKIGAEKRQIMHDFVNQLKIINYFPKSYFSSYDKTKLFIKCLKVWYKDFVPEFIKYVHQRLCLLNLNFSKTRAVFERLKQNKTRINVPKILKRIRKAVVEDLKNISISIYEIASLHNSIKNILINPIHCFLRMKIFGKAQSGSFEFELEINKALRAGLNLMQIISNKVMFSEINHWFIETDKTILNAIDKLSVKNTIFFLIQALANHPTSKKEYKIASDIILENIKRRILSLPIISRNFPLNVIENRHGGLISIVVNTFDKLRKFLKFRIRSLSGEGQIKSEDIEQIIPIKLSQLNSCQKIRSLNEFDVDKFVLCTNPVFTLIESSINKTIYKCHQKDRAQNPPVGIVKEDGVDTSTAENIPVALPTIRDIKDKLTALFTNQSVNGSCKPEYLIPIISAVTFKYEMLLLCLMLNHYNRIDGFSIKRTIPDLLQTLFMSMADFFLFFEKFNKISNRKIKIRNYNTILLDREMKKYSKFIDNEFKAFMLNNRNDVSFSYKMKLHIPVRFTRFRDLVDSERELAKMQRETFKWWNRCYKQMSRLIELYRGVFFSDIAKFPLRKLPQLVKEYIIRTNVLNEKKTNKLKFKK